MFDTLFENQVGFMYLLLAAIFFITRVIVRACPPKGINPIYGYRTKRSMKDQESWDFAQEHANLCKFESCFPSNTFSMFSSPGTKKNCNFHCLPLVLNIAIISTWASWWLLVYGCLQIVFSSLIQRVQRGFNNPIKHVTRHLLTGGVSGFFT